MKKLYRSKRNKIIVGVCGGIGEYLGVDPTLVRLLWLLLSLLHGIGIIGYAIAWIIIPEEP
jgi:phage shock protein PspC (stress-responsive transcriptional regulator)